MLRRQLQQHQSTLTAERQRITGFSERAATVPWSNASRIRSFRLNAMRRPKASTMERWQSSTGSTWLCSLAEFFVYCSLDGPAEPAVRIFFCLAPRRPRPLGFGCEARGASSREGSPRGDEWRGQCRELSVRLPSDLQSGSGARAHIEPLLKGATANPPLSTLRHVTQKDGGNT